MPKCRENRKRRLKRRKKHEERLESKLAISVFRDEKIPCRGAKLTVGGKTYEVFSWAISPPSQAELEEFDKKYGHMVSEGEEVTFSGTWAVPDPKPFSRN